MRRGTTPCARFGSRVVAETADACSVVLEPPAEAAERFTYSPGQFLTLRLPCEGGAVRTLLLAMQLAAPHEPMRIAVKRVADGSGSNWINDAFAPVTCWTACHRPARSPLARSTRTSCFSPAAAASRRCCRS